MNTRKVCKNMRRNVKKSTKILRDEVVELMKKKGIDNDLIKGIKRNNFEGLSVFTFEELKQIESGVSLGLSSEDLRRFIKINDDRSVYSSFQMNYIIVGLRKKFPIEFIDMYSKLNNKMKPVYNNELMFEIFNSYYSHETSFEDIQKYSVLNSEGDPIYNSGQMTQIRAAIKQNFPEESLNVLMALRDEKPVFDFVQMEYIRKYDKITKPEIAKQINECIKDGLGFEEISPLMHSHISPKEIRILNSFYKSGCSINDVDNLVKKHVKYDDLKEIKYLLQCAKNLNIDFDQCFEWNKHHDIDVEKIKENISESTLIQRNIYHINSQEILIKCLSCKMPPEQIVYIADEANSWSPDKMKAVAIALLNGLTMEEVDIVKKENKKDYNPLYNILVDATKEKFNDISNINENISLNTEIFDSIENER